MPEPFNILNEHSIEWIETRSLLLAKSINKTTLEALREILKIGYESGDDVKSIARSIRGYFDNNESFRAERLARTEIIAANNSGTIERYKEEGVLKKEWMAALDERTRDSHREADGQTVGIDEDFVVGSDRMQAPGLGGDPSENINCRCTLLSRD